MNASLPNRDSDILVNQDGFKLFTLGEFRMQDRHGEDVTPSSNKARGLILLLAMHNDERLTRNQLASLLWQRHAEAQARTSLRQCLTSLRRSFGDLRDDVLAADREHVQLYSRYFQLDLDDLEAGDEAAWRLLVDLATRAPRVWLDGINTNDPGFAEWLSLQRDQVHKRVINSLEQALKHVIVSHPIAAPAAEVLTLARYLRQLDVFNETAIQAALKAQLQLGDKIGALRLYREFATNLQQRFEREPPAAIRALYEQLCKTEVAASAPVEFPRY